MKKPTKAQKKIKKVMGEYKEGTLHSALTPSQKTAAKARAKKAGRPYPNLVDNAAVKKMKRG